MNCVFVCVNFNGAEITKNFIYSVEALNDNDMNIRARSIVVDNASSASDYSKLEVAISECESAQIIRSAENLGYLGGLNIGLSSLDDTTVDYVIIGNNDLVFKADFLKVLSTRNYHSDVLVIAPNVVTLDGYHQNPHCINRVSATRKFLYRLYYLNYGIARWLTFGSNVLKALRGGRRNAAAHQSQYIHMGIGACYVLPKAFFKYYSQLDDSVFLYGEEALLAGQVMAVDGKTYYDSGLIVKHAESATLSKLPSKTNYELAKESFPKYRPFL